MSEELSPYKISILDDPQYAEEARQRREKYERNWAWLEAHASEVYSHRGKIICVSGQELFVGDTTTEVLAAARAAHPDDNAPLTRIVPKERGVGSPIQQLLVMAMPVGSDR